MSDYLANAVNRRGMVAAASGALLMVGPDRLQHAPEANLTFTPTGPGAATRPLQEKLRDTLSVLDFIPAAKHASIKSGTNTDDLTAYFQTAAVAAESAAPTNDQTICLLYVPNGTYHITKVGIRGLVLRGETKDGTTLKAHSRGRPTDFMLDAMLDRDGVTPNTYGGGWAENLTIDASGGRSGLRLYGGGGHPHQLNISNAAVGLAYGLPIWCRVSNVYARNCGTAFHTFHDSPGGNGTSAVFEACWALDSARYGFHISQLYYSSFINCVSQNAGAHNFYIQGDLNGASACYSLQFIGCATEGSGTPFLFRKVRELTVINPRVIMPASDVDFIVLDDAYGSIMDFSTPAAPGRGQHHINATRNSPYGAVLLIGGDVTYDPASEEAFTRVGVSVNGAGARSFSAHEGYRVRFAQVVGPRDTGWSAATGRGSKGAYGAEPAGRASEAYTRAELQRALDRIAAAEARIVAYDAALRAHGLIGT